MKRGVIKVISGKGGREPRIQEELGDSVKVYSLKEWNLELERRRKEDEAKANKVISKPDEIGQEKPIKKVTKKATKK